jgi:hypothetical protein
LDLRTTWFSADFLVRIHQFSGSSREQSGPAHFSFGGLESSPAARRHGRFTPCARVSVFRSRLSQIAPPGVFVLRRAAALGFCSQTLPTRLRFRSSTRDGCSRKCAAGRASVGSPRSESVARTTAVPFSRADRFAVLSFLLVCACSTLVAVASSLSGSIFV